MEENDPTYLLAFISITQAIGSSLDLKEVLRLIVKSTCETTGSKGCTLMLLDEAGERLEVKSSFGLSDQYVAKGPLFADKSISDTLKGKPVIIEDATSDPMVQYPQEAKQEGIASIVSVPITLKGKIIGVLRLYTSVPCSFAREDIDFLCAVAGQSGLAIENARMYKDVKTSYETVAGLTHCIKNITNVLKGGEYIVDKGFRDGNMEAVRRGWNITKSGCERVRELALDMLTLSKKREPEYEDCDPCLIAAEVAELIKAKGREKNVKVQTALDKGTGIVRVDRKGIFRCLMNLASNAIDACNDADGLVRIETFPVREKRSFGFRIIDNGHGIKEGDQKKLFHEIFSTKGSKGTGLGLSVTQSIISEHGGNIRCDSQVGKGTTFTIELPVAR